MVDPVLMQTFTAQIDALGVDLPPAVKFQRARRLIRDALKDSGIAQRIDALVARLLGVPPG